MNLHCFNQQQLAGRERDKLHVAFIHPDLGIGKSFRKVKRVNSINTAGGAERLVVDAALGLQNEGHLVSMYTAHHDQGHCFAETQSSEC